MTAAAGSAAQILRQSQAEWRGASRRIARYIAIQQSVAALLLAGAADSVLAFSNGLRFLLSAWIVANVALQWRRRRADEQTGYAALARRVEREKPELDNALIHAVQFAALLEAAPEHPAAPLMRRELERAEAEAARLKSGEIFPLEPVRRERRRAQIALAGMLASMLLFPRVWRFEAPRFLAFWQDNPPFTRTDFAILPGNATAAPGSEPTIVARLDGPLPTSLELVSARNGEAPQSTPMRQIDERTFAAQMANLQGETWYYIRGETGRSSRFVLRLKSESAAQPNFPQKREAKEPSAPPNAGNSKQTQPQGRPPQNANAGTQQSKPLRKGEKKAAIPGAGTGTGKPAAGQSVATRRANGAKPTDERALPFSKDRSGSAAPSVPRSLPTGKNGDISRYPVEYRRLVQDYFKSVAGR